MTSPNRVLFTAYAPASGTELWVSDGTAAGTLLVKDIFPGHIGSVNATGFTQLGANVLFSATDSTHGVELWTTNGTAAGTYMLKDILAGSGSGFTTTVNKSSLPTSLRPAGGKMVFLGTDGANSTELWVTDGTSAGTSLLVATDPTQSFPAPSQFAQFGTLELFSAGDGLHHSGPDDGKHGQELWVTDGTVAGTHMLKDIDPGVYASGSPQNIVDIGGGHAVFSATFGNIGRELWVTDGTAAGTTLLKDINPAAFQGSSPSPAIPIGSSGKAVFSALNGSTGTALWVTDGTVGGTSLLKTFSRGYTSGGFAFVSSTAGGTFQALGGEILFTGSDGGTSGIGASALWATDGTVAGTVKLSVDGVYVQGTSNGGNGFSTLGSKELFWSGSGLSAHPWVTDGTVAGTFQLSSTANNGNTNGFSVLGSKAVFTAFGTQIWSTDGTVAGTYEITTLTSPSNFAVANGKAIFQAGDTTHGVELWVSDGTFFGTGLLKDINTNTFHSSTPTGMTSVSLPCFAGGTRIATPSGDVAVEALRAGDIVLTAAGGTRAVRWIGHRAVDLTRHPRPWDVAPIRIAPDAFAAGQPHSPLRISPDHAVFADGVLIPIRYLVNGTTIAREPAGRVTWYHVELADAEGGAAHDVLLAEGLPSESFLDTGNRGAFANSGGAIDLHPDFARGVWQRLGCAPLVTEGPEVVALRSWLLERAGRLGHPCSADPAVAFTLDARPLRADGQDGWHHIAIPANAGTLHLRSRSAIPAEIEAEGRDTRRLGVALTGLSLDGRAAGLGHHRLTHGWHDAEGALRWTDGAATIDVRGLTEISLALHAAPLYWDAAAAAVASAAA